jgi:hypothetical protein
MDDLTFADDMEAMLEALAPSPKRPTPELEKAFGKVTSYNWKGDPYTDSNSRKWLGSWGKISEIGMAVSPDIEREFRKLGIKPKDKVEIELSDGSKEVRIWDNRTMQDAQAVRKFGKPLTGRFDLHHPYGDKPHEKDGVAVVAFRKAGDS